MDDTARLNWLMRNGYLPSDIRLWIPVLREQGVADTLLLNACLSEGFAPAYWGLGVRGERQLIAWGDRNRIDEAMKEDING